MPLASEEEEVHCEEASAVIASDCRPMELAWGFCQPHLRAGQQVMACRQASLCLWLLSTNYGPLFSVQYVMQTIISQFTYETYKIFSNVILMTEQ